jgi:signal transduction histidine kinase
LIAEYEQARQFRLLRYYLGVALISTTLLALVASYLFAEFSYRTLVAEIKSSTAALVNGLAQAVAGSLPGDATPFDRQTHYARHLAELPLGNIVLYSPEGQIFHPVDPYGGASSDAVIDQTKFARALAGETVVEVRSPAEASEYNPFGAVYTVETYAPLPAGSQISGTALSSLGVLVALQAAPELGEAVIRARVTGLVVSGLTMGLLFLTLLAVVGRADRLITARTEELLRAYTDLRQAERMRDDLNHMIVHDLRNPLNVISATFELMRLTPADTRLKTLDHFWDSVYAATQRMIGLIDDILAISKIEAGQLSPQFASTSLPELLADRINSFKPQATVENKQLHLDCPSDLTAELDPALVGRVIENLVSNAFKYTEPEGIIHVSARVENECIRLSVRDNGDGVPDDYKQRIFEKFAQAPDSNGQVIRKGVGLGLTFCNLVAQAHCGQIWVTDAPGGGSEFVLTLPQRQNGTLP